MFKMPFLHRFLNARRGNVALITALTIVPVLVTAGGLIDTSMLMSARDSAQSALDAATLNAAGSTLTDSTSLQTMTTSAFNANVASTMASNASVSSFNYNSTTRTITATASGSYTTTFGQLVNVSSIPFTVNSTATRQGSGSLEVALVLDNTWSMSVALDASGTKIAVLKTAAQNLINQIMTAQNSGFVKVAVVPYADYVNVGLANRNQSWITVPADYSVYNAGSAAVAGGPTTCTTISTKTSTTCSGGTPTQVITSYTDGIPNYSTQMVGQTCVTSTVNITPYQSCTQNPAPKAAVQPYYTYYKWYGCVANLVQANGSIAMPDPATPYLVPNKPNTNFIATSQKCLKEILPLTSDKTAATAAITGLVVNIGSYKPETYIPGGLTWGVNVLSHADPFNEGAAWDPNNKQPRKAIILMTDGSNTQYLKADGTLATGNTTQVAKTYTDQQAICDYAKAQKIEVFTIGFGVTDQTSLNALKACATDGSHYFDAASSSGLLSAFAAIAGALQNVRIAS